jgi:thiamine biosynthesis lipoprotein
VDAPRSCARVSAGTAVDLGAMAKGWIAERALAAMRRAWPALPGALVDLGGDIAVTGCPPEGHVWLVDVEDPRRAGSRVCRLEVRSGGVATSGRGRRRFGPRLAMHHLIDPRTSFPAADGPVAATAVHADPAAADAHATALAVTGEAELADYVRCRPGLGAIVVPETGPPLVLGEVAAV